MTLKRGDEEESISRKWNVLAELDPAAVCNEQIFEQVLPFMTKHISRQRRLIAEVDLAPIFETRWRFARTFCNVCSFLQFVFIKSSG